MHATSKRHPLRWAMRLLGKCLEYPGMLALVLLVRLLRPVVRIRFGYLRTDRIGHFALDADLYLCERRAGPRPRRVIDLFYFDTPPCNRQLARMLRRVLSIHPLVRRLARFNGKLPGAKAHTVMIQGRDIHQSRDVQDVIVGQAPRIAFTACEEQRGRRELASLGIPEGARIVCVHNRDTAYLDHLVADVDTRYHDYRDFPVGDFVPTIRELLRRGYYVIRMGHRVAEPLRIDSPRFIDYASHGRSDFLDVYLSSRCHFFIGNTSGLFFLASIFRRPVLLVNFIPLEHLVSWGPDDVVIPKNLCRTADERLLGFEETIQTGAGAFLGSQQFKDARLRVVNNDPAEILEAAKEMDDRLAGTWSPAEGDESLQQRFRAILKGSKFQGKFRCHVGAHFLRKHAALLEPRAGQAPPQHRRSA